MQIKITVLDAKRTTSGSGAALSDAFCFDVSYEVSKANMMEVQKEILEMLTRLNKVELDTSIKRNGY